MASHPSRAALIKLLKRRRGAARTDRSAMWVLLDYLLSTCRRWVSRMRRRNEQTARERRTLADNRRGSIISLKTRTSLVSIGGAIFGHSAELPAAQHTRVSESHSSPTTRYCYGTAFFGHSALQPTFYTHLQATRLRYSISTLVHSAEILAMRSFLPLPPRTLSLLSPRSMSLRRMAHSSLLRMPE